MIDVKTILPAIKGYVLGWVHSYMDVNARLYNTSNISISNGTTTTLTFNGEYYDTAMHSLTTNTGRLTCRIAGSYLIGCNIRWDANATGVRMAGIVLNAATYLAQWYIPTSAAVVVSMNVNTIYNLAVDDYVEVWVYQNSGGALNIIAATALSPEFWIQRMS